MAPANTAFLLPAEWGPLFLPALERLQTLYPGAYARGTTSTSEGAEILEDLNMKLSAHNHLGAFGLNTSRGEVTPPPPKRHR